MRVVLVLIIGGGLLWVALRGTRDAQGADSDRATAQRGYLVPADDTPRADAASAQAPDGSHGAALKEQPEPPRIEERPSAPVPHVADVASGVDARSWLELATELAHRPASMSQYMAAHPSALPAERAELIAACVDLSTGEQARARALHDKLSSSDGALATRMWLLDDVSSGRGARTLSAVPMDDPVLVAGWIGLRAADAKAAVQARRYRDAARAYSDLLLAELDAPWKPERASLQQWTEGLRFAQAHCRWSRDGDWPSARITVAKGESLIAVRKRALAENPQLLVCTGLIERANEIKGSVLQPGQQLRIPTDKARMLVDLSAHWAVYLFGDEAAAAWEVGVGGAGSETKPGEYRVGDKSAEPMWFPQGKAPVPFGDPENPLGTRWIAWLNVDGGTTRLGFHGTKDPESVGKDLSQGCIRMRNPEVEELFEILPKDAVITVQP